MAISKAPKLNPTVAIIGSVVLLFVANWVSVRAFNYPFLVCWTEGWMRPLYMAWGAVILYGLMAFTAYQIYRVRMVPAVLCVLAIVAIFELPQFVDHLFRLGGICG